MSDFQSSVTVCGMLEAFRKGKCTALAIKFSTYPCRLVEINRQNRKIVHMSLLGYGGGSLSGDTLNFVWKAKKDAIICIQTQGTTKIFKSTGSKLCEQNVMCEIADGGMLCFCPDSTSLFEGARLMQRHTYFLDPNASLVFVDWYSCGRQNMGEFWMLNELHSRLDIYIDGKRVLLDNLRLSCGQGGSVASQVGGRAVFGLILLVGSLTAATRKLVDHTYLRRQSFEEHTAALHRDKRVKPECQSGNINSPTSVSVSHLDYTVGGDAESLSLSVIRFGASSCEEGYRLLSGILLPLESVLGYRPYSDRMHAIF